MFSRSTICASCRKKLLYAPARTGATARPVVTRQRGLSYGSPATSTSTARTALRPRQPSRGAVLQTIDSCSVTRNRGFTSTSQSRAAATLNPRTDEDGNAMEVDITPRAAKRLREMMIKDANPKLCLRVQVESGGCHGFQYLMSLTDTDKISRDEDTVFESEAAHHHHQQQQQQQQQQGEGGGPGETTAKVVMDEPSLELLKGSKVDYTMELIGSQFKIVDNPLATSSCGCGTSFDIKV